MKSIKRDIALFLTLCMVFTGAIPAYAEEVNIPGMPIEMFEAPAKVAEVVVEEAVAVEAAEAVEAELTEGEAGSEIPAGSAEKAELALALLGDPDPVCYLYWDDSQKKLVEGRCTSYTPVASDTTSFESGKWYVVSGTVDITTRINNTANTSNPAHLILCDGSKLNAPNGIRNSSGNGLIIYAQTNEADHMGELIIDNVPDSYAGIGGNDGGNGGTITINGGKIQVQGGHNGAGIGGGHYGNAGSVTINGGIVTATGGIQAAAIGDGGNSGQTKNGGSITINGGMVTATAATIEAQSYGGAGIGGGAGYNSGTITITGGIVTATGGGTSIGGAGIGGGCSGSGGDITIEGGTVIATGGPRGAGIGGGIGGNGGTTIITGGTVKATGGEGGAGIGGGGTTATSHGAVYVEEKKLQIYSGTSHEDCAKTSLADYRTNRAKYFETRAAEVRIWNVTWKRDEETTIDTTEVADGEMPVHNDAEKDGFIFTGWDPALSPAKKDITYTAKFVQQTPDKVAVSFNTNGGSYVDTQVITKGGTAARPADPTKTGSTFVNWYTDNEFGTLFNFEQTINENTVVYAKWTENTKPQYTIKWLMGDESDTTQVTEGEMPTHEDAEKEGCIFTGWTPALSPVKEDITYTAKFVEKDPDKLVVSFDTDGGSFVDPQLVKPGEMAERPADPQKAGHVFSDWYDDTFCTTKFDFSVPVTEDTITYAGWNIENYSITWSDHEGKEIAVTQAEYGTIPEFPAEKEKALEREGYVFIGWAPTPEIAVSDAVYMAQYEEKTIDVRVVSFDTDGGSFVRPQLPVYGGKAMRPADPQKAGYVFRNWYADKQLETLFNFNRNITEDTTVYAGWTEEPKPQYTVTWNMDDGTLIDTTRVNKGEMPVYENPSKDGYIFVGWNPAPAPAYTARFEKHSPDKAAVTFNTDGGSFVETQVITKGQKAVRPSDPVKTGYEFVNWYADAAFAALYDFNTAVAADITVYAKWKKNAGREYTITFKDWDGKTLAATKVEEGGLPDYPGTSNPSRSGYIFTGWTPKIGLVYADTTYTATYAPQTVINGGGGGGSSAPAAKKATVTFSPNWNVDVYGVWRITNSAGQVVTNAWLCDDAVDANGQNVWYLLGADGAMLAAGLVQDNTGNFYSLETNHDGYFGMLRYTDGYYNCNGQQVYLKFSHEHNGTFGAVINADGIEKLKAIYGVTKYGIGNDNAVYTKIF